MKSITESKFLSDKERDNLVKLLERHKGERDSIMFRLQLYTGARCSEILLLNTKSFSNGCVNVVATKKSNDRTIPLSKPFFEEILQYVKDFKVKDKLFKISSRQYRRLWDVYRPNKNKGTHTLRHTAGILLYINSDNIHIVKTFLGHKQLNNTMVYLEYVEGPRKLRTAMKGMWNNKILEDEK